jgi:hypothetical protein
VGDPSTRRLEQKPQAILVGDLGAMHLGFEDQSLRVYQEVSLSAFDLLASVIAALFSAYAGRLYRLAIYNARARLRISLQAHPHPLAQSGMHPFPGSIHSPSSEVVVDGLSGWELMGQ